MGNEVGLSDSGRIDAGCRLAYASLVGWLPFVRPAAWLGSQPAVVESPELLCVVAVGRGKTGEDVREETELGRLHTMWGKTHKATCKRHFGARKGDRHKGDYQVVSFLFCWFCVLFCFFFPKTGPPRHKLCACLANFLPETSERVEAVLVRWLAASGSMDRNAHQALAKVAARLCKEAPADP